MLDCHCHLDRYEDPTATAADAGKRDLFIIAVTNLPSHFRAGLPHVRRFPRVRLAVGLHPLAAADHERERQLFRESLSSSSFVGEVGLDFSQEGKATKVEQVKSFRFVAELLATHRKVASLHSRRAESVVLETLSEFSSPPAIFHWYSGPLGVLDQALARGDYFSVNPAMTRSENGKKLIARIPPDRLLTETDGPYVQIGAKPAKPWDVSHVEIFLAGLWSIPQSDVRTRVWNNFQTLLKDVGLK